ncbi:MAG: hypothetical protein ACREBI_11960 [Nitrosotalea sp.]
MRNWIDYNEKLVRRDEILISDDVIKSWNKELELKASLYNRFMGM